MVNRITEAIYINRQSQEAKRIQILNKLKPVRVILIQKSEKLKCHRKNDGKNPEDQEKIKYIHIKRKKKHIHIKPLINHLRISPSGPKRCLKKCDKTHFSAVNIIKLYAHSHLLDHHKCK